MDSKSIVLVGVPMDCGSTRPGCLMGPDALRTAEIGGALKALGHQLEDHGNISVPAGGNAEHPNQGRSLSGGVHGLGSAPGRHRLRGLVRLAASRLFLGGDHGISGGTVAGLARRAKQEGRPLFVLWLDAHPDFHSLATTVSGHIHGTPVAYFTGQPGFEGYFPALEATVPQGKRLPDGHPLGRRRRAQRVGPQRDHRERHARHRRAWCQQTAARLPGSGEGGRRHAARQPRHRLPRPGDRAGGRHPPCRAAPTSARRISSWRCCTTAIW